MDEISKKEYSTPELTIYGELSEITRASQNGSRLDMNFTAGTHIQDITFS